MDQTLPPELLDALPPFLHHRTVVAFDFGGTLAPIGLDQRAYISPRTRALLAEIALLLIGPSELPARVER